MERSNLEIAGEIAQRSTPVTDVLSVIEVLNGWGTIGLVVIVSTIGWVFWRLNSGDTPYRFGDTLIDPMTGKGSILRTAFLITLLVVLGIICYCVLAKQNVPGEAVAVLTIVVAPMIAGRYFETRDPRVVAQAEAMNTPPAGPPPSSSATASLENKP